MAKNDTPKSIRCSFCGKAQENVRKIVAGPGVYICDECVELCTSIIEAELYDDEKAGYTLNELNDIPSPKEIKKVLDDYVIGQDDAKRTLSVAVYNHYKRIAHEEVAKQDEVEIQKSNILLLGPTGCGKTLLARTLAKILNVPFAIADATTLTEAGYVGEDVENILLKLIQAADGDIEKAEKGIIYIDEIDKITRKSENPSITRDVRLPIIATLKDLDKEALIKILVEPKNSLVKQYQKLFEIDGVELVFEQEALEAIVDKAIERKTGARGLRSIIEEIMRDIMFEIPSNPNIEKCIITKATVSDNAEPEIVINENKERLKPVAKKKRQMPKTSEKETA